jgi:hypothetical protein
LSSICGYGDINLWTSDLEVCTLPASRTNLERSEDSLHQILINQPDLSFSTKMFFSELTSFSYTKTQPRKTDGRSKVQALRGTLCGVGVQRYISHPEGIP